MRFYMPFLATHCHLQSPWGFEATFWRSPLTQTRKTIITVNFSAGEALVITGFDRCNKISFTPQEGRESTDAAQFQFQQDGQTAISFHLTQGAESFQICFQNQKFMFHNFFGLIFLPQVLRYLGLNQRVTNSFFSLNLYS